MTGNRTESALLTLVVAAALAQSGCTAGDTVEPTLAASGADIECETDNTGWVPFQTARQGDVGGIDWERVDRATAQVPEGAFFRLGAGADVCNGDSDLLILNNAGLNIPNGARIARMEARVDYKMPGTRGQVAQLFLQGGEVANRVGQAGQELPPNTGWRQVIATFNQVPDWATATRLNQSSFQLGFRARAGVSDCENNSGQVAVDAAWVRVVYQTCSRRPPPDAGPPATMCNEPPHCGGTAPSGCNQPEWYKCCAEGGRPNPNGHYCWGSWATPDHCRETYCGGGGGGGGGGDDPPDDPPDDGHPCNGDTAHENQQYDVCLETWNQRSAWWCWNEFCNGPNPHPPDDDPDPPGGGGGCTPNQCSATMCGGPIDDGCGGDLYCGGCPSNHTCVNHSCQPDAPPSCTSGSTGWQEFRSAHTMAAGGNNTGWLDPHLAQSYGDGRASSVRFESPKQAGNPMCSIQSASYVSNLLRLYNANINIPNGATVTGAELQLRAKIFGGRPTLRALHFWRTGGPQSTSPGAGQLQLTGHYQAHHFGGRTDRWGLGDRFNNAFVTDHNFGIRIGFNRAPLECNASDILASVDGARVNVHYTCD